MTFSGRLLHHYARLLAAATFLLIIAGGMVTTTGSGLSVPDWPLSYGRLMPPMVGGIFYEHGHRLIASAVGLMTLVLAIWMGFVERRAWLRRLAVGAFGAVVVQGILGGLTVLFLLPPAISIFHACLAQTFFALIVAISFFTSEEGCSSEKTLARDRTLEKLALVTAGLIFAQLILGAAARHSGGRLVLISHVFGAFLVVVQALLAVSYISKKHKGNKKLLHPALFTAIVCFIQVILGLGAFIYTAALAGRIQAAPGEMFFVTGHQSAGALLLASSVFLFLRTLQAGGKEVSCALTQPR